MLPIALGCLGGPAGQFAVGFGLSMVMPADPTERAIDETKNAISCVSNRVTALA